MIAAVRGATSNLHLTPIPAEGEDEREEARLFYVGATRATQRLVIGASGGGKFAGRL